MFDQLVRVVIKVNRCWARRQWLECLANLSVSTVVYILAASAVESLMLLFLVVYVAAGTLWWRVDDLYVVVLRRSFTAKQTRQRIVHNCKKNVYSLILYDLR